MTEPDFHSAAMVVDYRALLVHYMAHILAQEGFTFTESSAFDDRGISTHLRTEFSSEETHALRLLAAEAKDIR